MNFKKTIKKHAVKSGIAVVKSFSDFAANITKKFEEKCFQDENPKILSGFRRSLQLDEYSCGVQSVYMILNYYDIDYKHKKLEKKLGTTEDGTDLKSIRALFKKHGLKTKIITNATLRDIKKAISEGFPILISVFEGEHWSTVYGYSDENIYIADPSVIKNIQVKISKPKFKEQWDRWIMIVMQ